MSLDRNEPPRETDGREVFYNAALVCTCLTCRTCSATLDPDIDLGAEHSFRSEGYYILLGDEACRRGWQVESHDGDFDVLCPGRAAIESK